MDASSKSGRETTSPMEQFSAFLGALRMPRIDVEEILASQKKNMEAFAKIVSTAAEGAGAIARRQAEMINVAVAENMTLVQEAATPGVSGDSVTRQGEHLKKAVATATANALELAELVDRSRKETFELICRRTTEALDEFITSVTVKRSR
jgi:phasin family protein